MCASGGFDLSCPICGYIWPRQMPTMSPDGARSRWPFGAGKCGDGAGLRGCMINIESTYATGKWNYKSHLFCFKSGNLLGHCCLVFFNALRNEFL